MTQEEGSDGQQTVTTKVECPFCGGQELTLYEAQYTYCFGEDFSMTPMLACPCGCTLELVEEPKSEKHAKELTNKLIEKWNTRR